MLFIIIYCISVFVSLLLKKLNKIFRVFGLVHTMYFILVAIYVANADGATKANAL